VAPDSGPPTNRGISLGFALSFGEFTRLVVPQISPREAVADYLQVDEAVAEVDSPDLTPVTVDVHEPHNVGRLLSFEQGRRVHPEVMLTVDCGARQIPKTHSRAPSG